MSQLVLITGASGGIGQALALRYYAAGYCLALVARRVSLVQDWAVAHRFDTGRYQVYGVDVADIDAVIAMGQVCIDAQGLPNVVIANAGISVGMDTSEGGDLQVMRETFAINNIGMAATFHPFLRAMANRGSGTLVGIGSVAGIRGLPGHGAYCASKAAVSVTAKVFAESSSQAVSLWSRFAQAILIPR